jgi:hypothetical protein
MLHANSAAKFAMAVCKVRGLTLLLQVRTLRGCGDGLLFEVPPLARDALLTTFHPLLENVPQMVCRKLQEDSGTGGFDLLIWLGLYGGCSNGDDGCPYYNILPMRFLGFSNHIKRSKPPAPLSS